MVNSPWNHNLHPRLEHNALLSFLWIYNLSFDSNVCSLFGVLALFLTPCIHSVTSSNISTDSHNASDIHNSTRHHTSTIHVPYIHPIPTTSPTFLPRPSRTNDPVVPFQTEIIPSHHSHHQPIFVVFEVLGGLLALGFLLCLGRFCYQYRKAPKRDRIAEVLHRHHLEREMEELERNPQILRPRNSLCDPAPPYCPRPPSYDGTSSPLRASTNYTDMDTRNLPSSLPQPSISIPPRQAG